jgi:predicted  nucleic acid-binding Zn-ribbon protein
MTDLRRDISLFVSVARIEATLHANRVALQKLPQDIAAIDRALAALEAKEKASRAALEEMQKRRRDVERLLREHEDHLRKCRAQQSLVKTNEEYTAMLKEIAQLEQSISNDEEQVLILMDQLEQAQRDVAAANEAFQREHALRTKERQALEAQISSITGETARMTAEKPKILSEIEPALLKRYERVAGKHPDVAVTRVEAEHCGACRQQLPPQVAVEVRKNDQFITCPACGRILIHYAD